MAKLLSTVLLVAVLSLSAVSQPFPHQDNSRHSDFKWNARKIGNKKVATLTIRKDEERDRRSIPLAERDDSSGTIHTRHAHRHHHGEGTRAAMWLANEHSLTENGARRTAYEGRTSEGAHRNLSPLSLAETGVEEGRRVRNNYVRPDLPLPEDHMPSLSEILEEVGSPINPSLLRPKTKSVRRGSTQERPNKRGRKSKRNRASKRNRNNANKKKRKGCRQLKGERKRSCLNALRQCRKFKKRRKKQCRSDALKAALDEDNEDAGQQNEEDPFHFLKNITEMSGTEACHYHHLKTCCTRAGLFPEGPNSVVPSDKCQFRKEFLDCMQHQQQHGTCEPTFHTRGDITALRKRIREFVWLTPNSCLISDAVDGWRERGVEGSRGGT